VEKKKTDFQAAEDYLTIFIVSSNYVLDDVYNVDETGLYYRVLPDYTFDYLGNTANGCKNKCKDL
jgi:hypothetical protein